MKNGISRWKRVALGLTLLLGAASAKAEAPAHCSYGYQDSSCLGPQYRTAQTPPTCSTDAGWTTLTPAQWIGSGFTQPVCHYEAPQTCPSGQTQTSDPVWNGSSWSAPGCMLPTAPPQDPVTMCSNAVPSGYKGSYNWYTGTADVAQATHIYALANNISGYSTAWSSQIFYGPYYPTLCATDDSYEAMCYINADGSLNALLVLQMSQHPNMGCQNH